MSMNTHGFPIFEQLLAPDDLSQWQKLRAAWQHQADATGLIDPDLFDQQRLTLKRLMDRAWAAVHRLPSETDSVSEVSALSPTQSPELAFLAGRQERLKSTPDTSARAQLQALLSEWEPLAQAYQALQARRQPRLPEKRSNPCFQVERFRFSSLVSQHIQDTLDRALEGLLEPLSQAYQHSNHRMVQSFLDAQEQQVLAFHPERGNPFFFSPSDHLSLTYQKGSTWYGEEPDPRARYLLDKALKPSRRETVGQATPLSVRQADGSTWQVVMDESLEEARRDLHLLTQKTLAAAVYIVHAKGEHLLESLEVVGSDDASAMGVTFQFQFQDGSSFQMRSRVQVDYQDKGNKPIELPLDYLQVTLSNGEVVEADTAPVMKAVFSEAPQQPIKHAARPGF